MRQQKHFQMDLHSSSGLHSEHLFHDSSTAPPAKQQLPAGVWMWIREATVATAAPPSASSTATLVSQQTVYEIIFYPLKYKSLRNNLPILPVWLLCATLWFCSVDSDTVDLLGFSPRLVDSLSSALTACSPDECSEAVCWRRLVASALSAPSGLKK